MNISTLCIILSATGAYSIWFYQTLKKNSKPEEQVSFSSLLLWSLIDTIMFTNTYRAKNDLWLIGTYTFWTIILTIVVLCKKQYRWSFTDTIIACIAIGCLIISYLTDPITGVWCGALSISAAGVPNLIGIAKQKPTRLLYLTIFFFFCGPLITVVTLEKTGGAGKEYIYPFVALMYWAIALCLAINSGDSKKELRSKQ